MVDIKISLGKNKMGSRKLKGFNRKLPANFKKGLGSIGMDISNAAKDAQGSRPFPLIQTSTLVTSFTFQLEGNHTVIIGAGGLAAAYFKALEGVSPPPNWPKGTKYPTMQPVWKKEGEKAIDKFQKIIAKPLDR